MKKLFQISLISIMIFSFGNAAYASNVNSPNETNEDAVYVEAVRDPEPPAQISPLSATSVYEFNILGPRYQNSKAFIRYLTGSWAKSDKYTWTETQSVALTFSTNITADAASKVKAQFGLAASYTTTYSVGVSIPADPTKFSKLSYNMDLMQQYIQYKRTVIACEAGVCVQFPDDWVNTTYIEPTSNSYLIVKYQ
ncbi:hypothetical protein AB4Z45_03435 [Paenibacillus sp. MCAF9]|uniref:hypothetical protein n=1 Tax=Paenibacillus sp. MCAF9 TaxID=3233046 RepID=UPI003F944D7C